MSLRSQALKAPEELLLVRHGETEWNSAGRLQGQLDSPLTARGLAQARAAGEALRSFFAEGVRPPIVTSPLGRARQTAEAVAQVLGHADLISDDRLKEVAFGQFEGLTESEVLERFPSLGAARRRDKWNFLHPGGESYAGTVSRIAAALEAQAHRPCLLIVAHSGIGRVVRGLYDPRSERELAYLGHPQNEIVRLRLGRPEEILRTSAPG